MADIAPITLARFWSNVHVQAKFDCWPWKGCASGGRSEGRAYGRFVPGILGERLAHRIAYRLLVGSIPDGKMIRHLCHNPTCCNPSHLRLGTAKDNSQDEVARNNTLRGIRHPLYKLTDEDVLAIRESPLPGKELAERYGVARSTISDVRNYRVRKHVEGKRNSALCMR